MNKKITKKEAIQLLTEIGSQASISIQLLDENNMANKGYVLNNSMIYNPKTNKPKSGGSNFLNAKRAVNLIEQNGNIFNVYSSYFFSYNGNYEIIKN